MIRTLVVLLVVLASGRAEGTVRVVTTSTDLAAIAREVGGPYVEVTSICKGYEDPHYVQAKPSLARELNRADLLVYAGLELEVGWLPLLIQGARNPEVRPGAPGHLDASAVIEVLEKPVGEVDRSHGDIHALGNPHYTLDPRNGVRVGRLIAGRLAELDPAHAADYRARADSFEARMQASIRGWEEMARPLRGAPIVTYHKYWEYFANWIGLRIVGCVENRPGIAPSPRHIEDLIGQMEREDVHLVLVANFAGEAEAAEVARRAGARLVVAPGAVEGEAGVRSYEDLFGRLIRDLLEADLSR